MVIVDTGVLYAMADRDDRWHERVKAYLQTQTDILIVPVTVLPEICYLLNTYISQDAETLTANLRRQRDSKEQSDY